MPPCSSVSDMPCLPAGCERDDVLAATEGDLGEGDLFGVLQGFADGEEGFGLRVVFGDDEVGLLEVLGVDLVLVDELRDLHGVLGGDAEVRELFGLDGDVVALGVLVAFDDLALADDGFLRRGFVGAVLDGGGEHLLVAHALAGAAIDLMELDVALGLSGDEEFYTERDERDCYLSAPIRTCHPSPLLTSKKPSGVQ